MYRIAIDFISDTSGLESVEYAVMTALIIGGLTVALSLLGSSLVVRVEETEAVISSVKL